MTLRVIQRRLLNRVDCRRLLNRVDESRRQLPPTVLPPTAGQSALKSEATVENNKHVNAHDCTQVRDSVVTSAQQTRDAYI